MYAKHTTDPGPGPGPGSDRDRDRAAAPRPGDDRPADTPHPCESWPDSGRGLRDTLDRIGDKWSVLVIGILNGGPLRFGALQQRVPGISQRMLTLTLRHLERDGVVSRTVHAEVPPRVEYQLTPLGQSLRTIVQALAQWVTDHNEEIEDARHRYDAE